MSIVVPHHRGEQQHGHAHGQKHGKKGRSTRHAHARGENFENAVSAWDVHPQIDGMKHNKRTATVPDLKNYKVTRKDDHALLEKFDGGDGRKPLNDFANVQPSGSDPTSRRTKLIVHQVTTKRQHHGRVQKVSTKKTPSTHQSRRAKKSQLLVKLDVTGPLTIIKDDDSMGVENHHLIVQDTMTSLPPWVRDIDSDHTNFLFTPHYAQDIMNYLQSVESRWTFPVDYLQKNPEVTPKMRAILMDWLIQVQTHQRLGQETLHLCASLIDRFLCLQSVTLIHLQLLGITSLLVAAKFAERFPPEIETLCHLTDNTYTPEEVLLWERELLKVLDFNVNLIEPTVFLSRFYQIDNCTVEVKHLSSYLIDLSLPHVQFVHFRASLLAASALYLARDLLGISEIVWSPDFEYYTKYCEQDLIPCVTLLAKILLKVKTSKYQGTFAKYSSSSYGRISNHECLTESIALQKWIQHPPFLQNAADVTEIFE